MEVKTSSPKETQKIAKALAKTLTGGEVIALFGDLGAGKTTFVQGLAKGLGIKRNITSPTYVFMRTYPFAKKGKEMTFYHIDLYRGEEKADFAALGLDEIFSPDSIVVLEWAERLENFLPKERINVKIETVDIKTRRINVKRAG
jgi:tRNA threonylcarbamoyladenosine biosynthesis protein TsaE